MTSRAKHFARSYAMFLAIGLLLCLVLAVAAGR